MTWNVAQVFDIEQIPDYTQLFKQAGADIIVTRKMCTGEDAIIAAARNADALICAGSLQPITRRVMESLEKCRFIQSLGIGFEKMDVAAATDLGIMAANVPDYCLEEVSDHAMGLILACTRSIVALHEITKAGKWDSVAAVYVRQNIWPRLSRLKGQTLGLIGMGRIPQALVPKAKAFGLKIIGFDPYLPQGVYDSLGVENVAFDELLKRSDIVSLHAPLTNETKGLMGREQFKQMKSTAFLINTSRGPLVKTRELYDCLIEKTIAGAGLDVIEPEPIDPNDPILQLDNVIITAHSAGASPMAMAEMYNRPREEMINVLIKNQWPRGLLNHQVKEKYQQKWGGR